MMSARILIVDDQEEIASLLNSYFMREGYAVGVASDAESAKELAEENEFDVALVDIMLPDVDGLELLEWLQESRPKTLVFMMTGLGFDSVLVEEAVKKGASGYFNKTQPLGSIHSEIRKALRMREEE